MAVQITLLGETALVVNVYAPSVKTERESMFESLLLLLQAYDGPMFVGGDFSCTLEPRLDRSFISPPGRHDSLALRRLLGRAQVSDVLDGDMEIAEEERTVPVFHAAAHTYFYTLPGCGSASSRLDRWYASTRHADRIRDVAMSVPGLSADHNGISIRIGVPRHVVRIRNMRRVYPIQVVHMRPRTKPSLRPLRWPSFELTRLIMFRRQTIPQPGDWPTGGTTRR